MLHNAIFFTNNLSHSYLIQKLKQEVDLVFTIREFLHEVLGFSILLQLSTGFLIIFMPKNKVLNRNMDA